MKKILGLDLGTNSIGWALVNEAEKENEKSGIIKIGVRVNPLTTDEQINFEKGKSITSAAERTKARSARRSLQRFKLRRESLLEILKENAIIPDNFIYSEEGNASTFRTFKNRALAVTQKIDLLDFARVLLMLNKKRGYKSSRKAKNEDEGQLIDGMSVAKKLYEENLTPGQFVNALIKENIKIIPDFYRSDLQIEFDKIWNFQKQYHADILTDEFLEQIKSKGKAETAKIFLGKYKIFTAENKGQDKKVIAYKWRTEALSNELTAEQLAYVLADIRGNIKNSSGYLGAISDRSKELYFNAQTVGQYLYKRLDENPNTSLKNQTFYRQDYMDEFEKIWETQAKYHALLNNEIKAEIRDVIIFYQRKLKSQKGLISFCEFENEKIEVVVDGKKKIKTRGSKVCPKSSPLFQEFKIWQILNNLEVTDKKTGEKYSLNLEEKELLYKNLNLKDKLSKTEVLKLVFDKPLNYDLNYKDVEGNKTNSELHKAYYKIISFSGHDDIEFDKLNLEDLNNTISNVLETLGIKKEILIFDSSLEKKEFEKQLQYQLWHLLYSFESDNSKEGNQKLLEILISKFGFAKEYAHIIANVNFQDDYSGLSTKAIRNILPYLKEGNKFDVACVYAGYNHSKSETKEEKANKILKAKLDILPKNTLRNPVVEKILNQMINVINTVNVEYGKPDEIRIELARELKKSAKEREEMTKNITSATTEHERYKDILQKEFGLAHISRNDLIRYKLYEELKDNGYKTLYTNTYIPAEKLFSKEFDIEHIIPQSRLFDDSFSNKTLELRSANIEKKDRTAYDYVKETFNENEFNQYISRIEQLSKSLKFSKAKYKKLLMKGSEIPEGFIDRDLRDTQYIAKKAKSMLEEVFREVNTTTGSITDRLREDWQLIDIMKELNWDKYDALGLTTEFKNRDGQTIKIIKDWTKRNDQRHHAVDALTVAFTKRSHVQYLNNLNARSDKSSSIYGIEQKELYRNDKNKLLFKPPFALNEFRAEAKKQLENTIVSFKAKNKVVTTNKNKYKTESGIKTKTELTPRGQLHLDTIYGKSCKYETKLEKVGASFTTDVINNVAQKKHKDALLKRLAAFDNDPKKAFTGKNALDKTPIYIDDLKTQKVPEKVKLVWMEPVYTKRKEITHELKIEKVVDSKIKIILENRLKEYGNDPKAAFSNLSENPIWLNKDKGICIKRVAITGISNAIALHDKKDKDGKFVLDENGNKIAVNFVNTGNNHHVTIYRDEKGNLQEKVVTFFEAVERVNQGLPVIDKSYKQNEGWQFIFTMKQNEIFVFPNDKTGFDPNNIDLTNPENYYIVSPNLFRVQKFGSLLSGFWFRSHLETKIDSQKELKSITYKVIQSTKNLERIIKVRIDHLGKIVSIGEY
jgi:CRISPR-associated endonuclease Csn1